MYLSLFSVNNLLKSKTMKKKSIKHLKLGKKTVSKLTKNEATGGAPESFYVICPTPPITIYCTFNCTVGCGTLIRTCNSVQACQTIEVDTQTLPIC